MCLFFKPKQSGGDSEKTYSILPNTLRPNKKSNKTLAVLKDSKFCKVLKQFYITSTLSIYLPTVSNER